LKLLKYGYPNCKGDQRLWAMSEAFP